MKCSICKSEMYLGNICPNCSVDGKLNKKAWRCVEDELPPIGLEVIWWDNMEGKPHLGTINKKIALKDIDPDSKWWIVKPPNR